MVERAPGAGELVERRRTWTISIEVMETADLIGPGENAFKVIGSP